MAPSTDTDCVWDNTGVAVIPDGWVSHSQGPIPVKGFLELHLARDGIEQTTGTSSRISYRAGTDIKCCQPMLTGGFGDPIDDKYWMFETFSDGEVVSFTFTSEMPLLTVYMPQSKPIAGNNIDLWTQDPCMSDPSMWVARTATFDGVDVYTLNLLGTDLFLGVDPTANPTPGNYFLNTFLVDENDPNMFYARFLAIHPDSVNYPGQKTTAADPNSMVDVCWMNYWTPEQWTDLQSEVLEEFPDCAKSEPWEDFTPIPSASDEPYLAGQVLHPDAQVLPLASPAPHLASPVLRLAIQVLRLAIQVLHLVVRRNVHKRVVSVRTRD
eukprot:Clim_evm117s11 gene=Clim_evmTU117s11